MRPGTPLARHSFGYLDRRGNRTFETVVDLRPARVLSWTEVTGVQAPLLEGEYDEMSRIVKADPRGRPR